ncbi:hypothetical protein HYZ41_03915 [archaeon]|nr:hypothetical protein [archaeon]
MKNVNITISVPASVKEEMDSFSDVNWSEAMRQMLSEKLRRMKVLKDLDKMLENSKLTDADVEKIGSKIKAGIAKRSGMV